MTLLRHSKPAGIEVRQPDRAKIFAATAAARVVARDRAVREDRRATAEVGDAAGVACPVAREGAAPSVEPVNADINVKFEWIGAPSEIITSQVPGTVSFYTPFSDTRAVPPTATGLRVTYEIDGYDDQSNGQIFLDDMSVMITSIPEPVSVILFGLGLLRLCGLRRR